MDSKLVAGLVDTVRRNRRLTLALGTAATLLAALSPPAIAAASKYQGEPVMQAGCATGRTAVAYGSNGEPVTSAPARRPIPCLVATGFPTMETHIAVAPDGALVYEPASLPSGVFGSWYLPNAEGPHPWSPVTPAGIAVSSSRGTDWSFVKPAGDVGAGNDAALYIDPSTGRLFMDWLAALGPSGGEVPPQDQTDVPAPTDGKMIMLMSRDDGKSWAETSIPGMADSENARFTAAPAAPGQATPAGGYPDVTYWCGNQNVGITWPVVADRQCYRSLDGGVSWEFRSILFANAVPPSTECSTPPYYSALDGNYPQGAPDGSLYVMVACTDPGSSTLFGSVYLARSNDEAATWPVLHQPAAASMSDSYVQLPVPSGAGDPELRVTTIEGTTVLVLAYELTTPAGPQVRMQTASVPPYTSGGSLSRPLVWSSATALTPAGLSGIDRWAVAVRGSELAASYLASTPGPSGSVHNGYLTMIPDVLRQSVIWMAMVNNPAEPMSTAAAQTGKDDFIGVAIGPDGTPWGSYFSPCSADPSAQTDPACEGAYLNGQPVNSEVQGGNDRGLVGSLFLGTA